MTDPQDYERQYSQDRESVVLALFAFHFPTIVGQRIMCECGWHSEPGAVSPKYPYSPRVEFGKHLYDELRNALNEHENSHVLPRDHAVVRLRDIRKVPTESRGTVLLLPFSPSKNPGVLLKVRANRSKNLAQVLDPHGEYKLPTLHEEDSRELAATLLTAARFLDRSVSPYSWLPE